LCRYSRLRLACQVRLSATHGAVEVVKRSKFWGQGDDVVGGGQGQQQQQRQRRRGEDGASRSINGGGAEEEEEEEERVTPFGAWEFVFDRDEWKDTSRKGGGGGGGGGDRRETEN
jgi:hypothetical protein